MDNDFFKSVGDSSSKGVNRSKYTDIHPDRQSSEVKKVEITEGNSLSSVGTHTAPGRLECYEVGSDATALAGDSGGKKLFKTPPFRTRPYPWSRLGCLGNLFCCGNYVTSDSATEISNVTDSAHDSPPPAGDTLFIEAKGRLPQSNSDKVETGPQVSSFSLTVWMRDTLAAHYGSKESVIGLGGVIEVLSGNVHGHVMPDFLGKQIESGEQCNRDWLRFFLNRAPVRLFATLITEDGNGSDKKAVEEGKKMNLRTEHTHFYGTSTKDGNDQQGGHYHGDLMILNESQSDSNQNSTAAKNEEIHYKGWLQPASRIIRVGDPVRVAEAMEAGALAKYDVAENGGEKGAARL